MTAPGAESSGRIRRLYLAATVRALNLVRRAVARLLRNPDDVLAGVEIRRRLARDTEALTAQVAAEARPVVVEAIEQAQQAGHRAAELDLGAPTSERTPTDRAEVLRLADEVTVEHQRIPAVVDNDYRRVVTDALAAEPGRVNRRRAAQRALDVFAERGIRVFRDRAGREWDIASYSEMAVRTAVTRARVDAYVARTVAAGGNFIRITGRPGGCGACAPYKGKVIAVGDLGDAREAGLFHPNCRCGTAAAASAPIPPTTGPEPDPARHVAERRLRYLERRVRAARRREAVALDAQALAKARRELRASWAAIREHVDQTGATRQRGREQIIRAR